MNTKLLKQKILDLAIRGKLVPQDPNDEPASVLLEQIKKEKEKLVKEGKIKKDKNESTIFVGDDKLHYEKLMEEKPINWEIILLDEVLYYEQPTSYIVNNTKYDNKYATPVLTAGKSFILGYTNEKTGIYDNIPCIIFDDFTTDTKYVDFPFKVKSSAMKILKCNSKVNIKFVYFAMQLIECLDDTHKRFWISIYSKKNIYLPPLSEQERIVSKIEELFKQVDAIEEEKQSLLKLIDKAKDKVLDLAMTGKLVKPDPNDEPASKLLEKIFEEKKKLAKEGKIKLSKDELLTPPTSVDNDYYEKIGIKLGMVCNLIKPKMTDNNKLPYLEVKYLRNQIPCVYKKEGMVLQNGDTVILVDGENSGEIFHIREEGYMGSTFMKLVMSDYIFQPYIEMFITKNKQYLKDNKKGSAIPHLNKNLFYNLDINLPSLKTQELVYNIVKNLSLQLHQIKAELN